MAHFVKCPTLDLSPGLDLTVVSSNPKLGTYWVWSLLKKKANKKIQSLEDSKVTYFLNSGNISQFLSLAQNLSQRDVADRILLVKVQHEQMFGGEHDALRAPYCVPDQQNMEVEMRKREGLSQQDHTEQQREGFFL